MSEIDLAAMRRFTFKFEFLPLKDEQRWKMFVNEAEIDLDGITEHEAEEIKDRLSAIKKLTPGDFATVKRQSIMLDKKLSIEEWLLQLKEESVLKLEGIESAKIGFGPKE